MPKTLRMLDTYTKDRTTFRKGTLQKLKDTRLEEELLAGGHAEDVNSKKKKPEAGSKTPLKAEPQPKPTPKKGKE